MTSTEILRPQIRRPATLQAFDSACSTTEVGKVVVGNRLAQSGDIRRLGSEVARGSEASNTRVTELSERVNTAVYTAIERMYDLAPTTENGDGETPQTFFQRHMGIADNTVRKLAESVNSNDPLLQEAPQEFASPADVIKHLSSPDTTPESRRAVTTRLAFGLTSAEQAPYFEGAAEVLSQVDAMISTDIVTAPRESGMVYTVHNNDTNEVYRMETDLEALLAQDITEDTHVKAHDLHGDFQHIGFTDNPDIGLVAIRSRIKSENTALLKTVRAAITRTTKEVKKPEDIEKGNNIVATDTKDFVGSTFVAMDAETSYDEKVVKLREKVKQQFMDLYPNLTDEDFEEDSKTGKKPDQVDFKFQRFLVNNIPGIEGYYEVMFFGQDYFDYKYAVGTTDEETGIPNGCAHSLYEGKRFFDTYSEIFKPEDADGIKRKMYEDRVTQLFADNRVDISDLQKEYEEQQLVKGGDIFVGDSRFTSAGVVYASI